MKMKLYVVYDKVAEESGPIFQAKNHKVAMRQYNHLIEKEALVKEDYCLICVGNWDSENAMIKAEHYVVETYGSMEVEDEQDIQ